MVSPTSPALKLRLARLVMGTLLITCGVWLNAPEINSSSRLLLNCRLKLMNCPFRGAVSVVATVPLKVPESMSNRLVLFMRTALGMVVCRPVATLPSPTLEPNDESVTPMALPV